MKKSLIIYKTHFIDEFVISETVKLQSLDTDEYKTVLFIDNSSGFLNNLKNEDAVQTLNFYGNDIDCIVFNEKILNEMKFPYYTRESEKDEMGKIMWYCSDYSAYIAAEYFPDYDYYWQFESDVYCNGDSYQLFFDKYADNNADLLINTFSKIIDSEKDWPGNPPLDWIYKGKAKYAGIFPVIRLSKRAIKFLYQRRLVHKEIYAASKNTETKNEWIYCEMFVPTECANARYTCQILDEAGIRYRPYYKLGEDECFKTQDFKLYHPVRL